MLQQAGVHAALIDMEHTAFDLHQVESLVIAAENSGIAPFVRPPAADSTLITRLLDSGVVGVVFPDIRTVRDAVTAMRSVLYPPRGARGWGGAHTRSGGWFGPSAAAGIAKQTKPYTQEFVRQAEQISTIFLVESAEGVDNIGPILESGQPDAVMFGWGDYSVEVGFDSERCEDAAQRVYDACKRAGTGCALTGAAHDRRPSYRGCFEVIGVDSLILSAAIAAATKQSSDRRP